MEKNQRMCIACRNMFNKQNLIRIVKTPNGYVLDKTGKVNGRGAYICNSADCINKCVKQKSLHKTFKENVSAEVYDKIKEETVK